MWRNHTVQKASALLLKLMQAWEISQIYIQNVSTIHICTSSMTKPAVSKCEFEGENVSDESNMYIT